MTNLSKEGDRASRVAAPSFSVRLKLLLRANEFYVERVLSGEEPEIAEKVSKCGKHWYYSKPRSKWLPYKLCNQSKFCAICSERLSRNKGLRFAKDILSDREDRGITGSKVRITQLLFTHKPPEDIDSEVKEVSAIPLYLQKFSRLRRLHNQSIWKHYPKNHPSALGPMAVGTHFAIRDSKLSTHLHLLVATDPRMSPDSVLEMFSDLWDVKIVSNDVNLPFNLAGSCQPGKLYDDYDNFSATVPVKTLKYRYRNNPVARVGAYVMNPHNVWNHINKSDADKTNITVGGFNHFRVMSESREAINSFSVLREQRPDLYKLAQSEAIELMTRHGNKTLDCSKSRDISSSRVTDQPTLEIDARGEVVSRSGGQIGN